MTIFTNRARFSFAYTLLEVLLALAVVAVLLGIAVPYLADSFRQTPGEETATNFEKTVLAVHAAALEKGEARKLMIHKSGVTPDLDSIPEASVPQGWKLEIRRMTESKFRTPEKNENWEFNGAGICEPLSLRLSGGKESLILSFDPLTALLVTDE